MSDDLIIDKRSLKRAFERAAATYDAAAVLQNEVCGRMLARLDYIKLAPATILDAGSGTGNAVAGLIARYPRARVIALDLAFAMARRARARRARPALSTVEGWRSLFGRGGERLAALCGDIEQLPLAPGCAEMVWSNLAIQWSGEPRRAFAEIHRVLAPGGLLMFSSFGPDTLKELRAAFVSVDAHTHVHRFTDLHDVGDLLVACGYADGYPRHAFTGTPVLVNGKRSRIVGRVSMDMITVDISGIPDARIGTPVTLWGEGLSADEVAAAAGTLSYELLCKLAARVPIAEVP